MPTFNSFNTSPPSWLAFIGASRVDIPEDLHREVDELKSALQKALVGGYENLETALEEMLPSVWTIRLHALPLLAKVDIRALSEFVHAEFSQVAKNHPPLSAAAEKLVFGLELMEELTSIFGGPPPDFMKRVARDLQKTGFPSLSEVNAQLISEGNEGQKWAELIRASLMMELLLLAVDIGATKKLPLSSGICYELDYQSAVTVKAYAAALGLTEEQIPWYQNPENDLERLLLSGPVLEEPEIGYILEKRRHLGEWK